MSDYKPWRQVVEEHNESVGIRRAKMPRFLRMQQEADARYEETLRLGTPYEIAKAAYHKHMWDVLIYRLQ